MQGDDRWSFTGPSGEEASVAVKGPLRSNNLSAILDAARAGMGLAVLPCYVARAAVADGALQALFTDHNLTAQEIHAVFSSPKLVPLQATNLINFLQQALAGQWWRAAL